ncbi:xanthine dehydrogenase YagR molybdenum-binding subunit [Filimonas lacunae]|uniref:Xanthine dehydrogenase YagR molybdenum-binding subunit n=1 Tax=Filimonas lacunae TaxID=477680 RepID=A0A173MHY1_9BACT|nr:xanthine dehydrogenase family protein molybdopterin-binding subunit [Filimonas lacunae]BAV07031.1 periplasmic aromatic aldehyde oxidoreductase, molybdenum binding subunit YagR [Filimonas lacunae]SIS96037.1 xanthine dehydrogenase YagR molybdenum-binding subunit [Filimonas lacunae]
MRFFENQPLVNNAPEGRVEGVAKVTGSGKYAAEYKVANQCYAVLVGSTIAAGTINRIHVEEAKELAGVLDVITHLHKPIVPGMADAAKIKESRFGLPILHTDTVYFKGQPIAVVIAETLEDATYAASLVWAEYTTREANVNFDQLHPGVATKADGKERGSVSAWADAPYKVDASYNIQHEVHNPMEMHATIAHWESADKLKLYDKNQGVNNVQRIFAKLWNIPPANIEVISEFVGGGFGSGLRVWPHALAAIMAARQVNRPVKLVLTRPQMFLLVGYRPQSWQQVQLGADSNGRFTGIRHQAKHSTSLYEDFNDGITRVTRMVYQIPNVKTESANVPLNLSTPTWMRGPGDCTGAFAVESAIDELSYQLKMDPVALRLKNLALTQHPESGKPWSTNFLNECIEKGAAMIHWQDRQPQPAQQKEGDWAIGYGMATGMWNAGRGNAGAAIKMQPDGTITVQTAMTDIGTGTGTAMQNITHEQTGITKSKIKIELGHSTLPAAPSQGGSTGLSSISGAVVATCNALKQKLAGYAATQEEVYKSAAPADILLSDTGISYQTHNHHFISYNSLFEKNHLTEVEVEASAGPGAERQQYAFCSSAAHFCRVKVNIKTGKVKIDKMVAVVDGGRIVNEKAAANQVSGAAVGGIGMALMEEQAVDHRYASLVGNDLAGYHFAVNADAPIIEVAFINKPDTNSNPSGAKGLGEVGIIGSAAAIANAIYHATGKRLRNLPVTPDKILLA